MIKFYQILNNFIYLFIHEVRFIYHRVLILLFGWFFSCKGFVVLRFDEVLDKGFKEMGLLVLESIVGC
jgi:hypothetical protein